jgi:glutaredoxin
MLNDIIETYGVFKNPDEVVRIAKQQKYYSLEEYKKQSNQEISFCGKRTLPLLEIDKDLHKKISNSIVISLLQESLKNNTKISYNFLIDIKCHFHYMTEEDVFDDSWWHTDGGGIIMVGLVYLNKNPKQNSGTMLKKDGQEIHFKNEFNKGIMYWPTYEHSPEISAGFGKNIDTGRLSILFYIEDLTLKLKGQ